MRTIFFGPTILYDEEQLNQCLGQSRSSGIWKNPAAYFHPNKPIGHTGLSWGARTKIRQWGGKGCRRGQQISQPVRHKICESSFGRITMTTTTDELWIFLFFYFFFPSLGSFFLFFFSFWRMGRRGRWGVAHSIMATASHTKEIEYPSDWTNGENVD